MPGLCILLCSFLLVNITHAQVDKYGQPAGFSDLHTVYVYQKSNWDGTHSSKINLYVADSNRLESFKHTEGQNEATLVTAVIDWTTYSVKKFTNHRLEQGKEPRLIAVLAVEEIKKVAIEVGPMHDTLLLTELPWQSYDFDFAGLGFVWRALKNKKEDFHFHIADAERVNGSMRFVNKGRTFVQFKEEVMLDGKKCLLYTVNGPGLENKGGQIWINAESLMIEQYRIELPDEPGFENGMLKLLYTKKMSHEEWEQFKNKAVGN
ncbi:MAG TPA: hypothetical protein PKC72_08830 [Chitinophagaceae bacterium]|nr:hypothetical protein [Chitinophagaceae bacterium]